MTLVEELIQVAAVAVSIVEDLTYGDAGLGTAMTDDIIENVVAERAAQDEKWGPVHRTPFEWLAILGEEYGEACQAAVDAAGMGKAEAQEDSDV